MEAKGYRMYKIWPLTQRTGKKNLVREIQVITCQTNKLKVITTRSLNLNRSSLKRQKELETVTSKILGVIPTQRSVTKIKHP